MRRFISYVGALFLLGLMAGALAACDLFGGEDGNVQCFQGTPAASSPLEEIPGKIVFSAYRIDSTGNETGGIYVLEDGDIRSLLPDSFSANPTWSPDGTQIAFASQGTTLGPYLYVMDADGSNLRYLKRLPQGGLHAMVGWSALWSPDGDKIATGFCLNCEGGGINYEIYVVEGPGRPYQEGDIMRLTDHLAYDSGPLWSPDGKHIAFASNRAHLDEEGTGRFNDVYVIKVDGSDLHRLTKTGNVRSYLWSPDGKCMAVSYDEELFLLDPENGNIERLQIDLPKKYEGVYLIDWPVSGKMLLRATSDFDSFTFFLVNPRTGQANMVEGLNNVTDLRVINLPDWFLPSQAR